MKCPFSSREQFAEFIRKLNELLEPSESGSACDHTLSQSMRVLKDMGFGGLARISARHWFQEHGGFCDCEIMLNVVPWSETGGIDAAGWRAIQ